MQSALFYKLISLNKSIMEQESLTIHICGEDAKINTAFQRMTGKRVGKSTVEKVTHGSSFPDTPPSVLYLTQNVNFEKALQYTRDNNILSISGIPEWCEKGITLVVCGKGSKPKVLINLVASKEEGNSWNPAILKVAKIVKK